MGDLHRGASSSERCTEFSRLWGFFWVFGWLGFFKSLFKEPFTDTDCIGETGKNERADQRKLHIGKKFKTGDKTSEAAACLTLLGMRGINRYLKRETFELMQRK